MTLIKNDIKPSFLIFLAILLTILNINLLFADKLIGNRYNQKDGLDNLITLYSDIKNDKYINETVHEINNSETLKDSLIHTINIGWNSHYYAPSIGIYFADILINKFHKETDSNRLKLYEIYIGKLYSVKAHCHHTKWENDSSYHYFSKSIYYRLKTGDLLEKIWAHNNITLYFNKIGKADSSAYYLHNAITLLKENTKYFHFTYDSHLLESKINGVKGVSSLIYLTYHELLLNYTHLGVISDNVFFVNPMGKYNEYEKLINEFNSSLMGEGYLYLFLKQIVFLINFNAFQENNLYDLKNKKKFDFYLRFYNQRKHCNILKLYNFINNLKNVNLKLTFSDWKNENVDTTIYYNPLEKLLFKIIEIKFSSIPSAKKRNILINQLKEIYPKLNHVEKAYLLTTYKEIFKSELNDYKPFEKYLKNLELDARYINQKYSRNPTVRNSILEFNKFHKFLLEKVNQYNVERFYLLIGIIVIVVIILLISIVLLIKNRKLTKSTMEINNLLIERNYINQKIYSVISHDLSAPISYFDFYLDEIERNVKSNNFEKAFEQINGLKTKSKFINSTLESMLDYLRFDNSKADLMFENINLNNIVDDIINLNIDYLNDRNVKIIKKGLEHEIYSEKTFMTVILRNLIQNSIKFTRSNSSIICELIKTQNNYIIKISDNGIGIEPKRKEAILNGIPITAGTDINNKQSSAFGFLLIRDLILKLKGKLEIEDNPEGGTIIFLTFHNKAKN